MKYAECRTLQRGNEGCRDKRDAHLSCPCDPCGSAGAVIKPGDVRCSDLESQQFHAENPAGCSYSAIEGGDWNTKPARQLEVDNIVSLQVVTQAEIDNLRSIKLYRQRFEFKFPERGLAGPEF